MIESGVKPEKIESALDLAADPERRIKFQHDVQKYVDQAISSTINLPAWGSELNNESTVPRYAALIQKYAKGLRGLTVYPDGSRGGQPITSVPYEEAHAKRGVIYEDNSEEACNTGVCGI
jgi:ribonucleoside-diphosphate reductase alpha chain